MVKNGKSSFGALYVPGDFLEVYTMCIIYTTNGHSNTTSCHGEAAHGFEERFDLYRLYIIHILSNISALLRLFISPELEQNFTRLSEENSRLRQNVDELTRAMAILKARE